MPQSDAILYSFLAALLLTMVGIIGYLINRGIIGVREDIQGLRLDLKADHDRTSDLLTKQESHRTMCEERHKRLDYEIANLKGTTK